MISIDLRNFRIPVTSFVKDAVAKFAAEYPNVEISTVDLSGDGFHGWITIHFDTMANSDSTLQETLQMYPEMQESTWWYGEDQHGRFGIYGEEFAFSGQSAIGLPDYPDFYSVDPEEEVVYIDLDGQAISIDREEGNEAFNEVFFTFLKPLLRSLEPFDGLRLAKVARAGIEVYDSKYGEFWVIQQKR